MRAAPVVGITRASVVIARIATRIASRVSARVSPVGRVGLGRGLTRRIVTSRRRTSAGRVAVAGMRSAAGSKRLSVGSKQLSAGRHAARHSRDGDEGGGSRRGHRLEDALLVHASAVLALAARGTLITTAADLRRVSMASWVDRM